MRFLLFHGTIESLNHFTDELCVQFRNMGHSVFVIELCMDYKEALETVITDGIDVVVCYDCFGMSNKELYDKWKVPVVNILMDHPMSLTSYMRKPPEKYIQLSPDKNHVYYAKKVLGLESVFFMPHMASLCTNFCDIPEERKEIEILFPAGFCPCNVLFEEIKAKWTTQSGRLLVLSIMEHLLTEPWNTLEGAMKRCLADRHIELPDSAISSFLEHSKQIDVFIRMYFREKIVTEIIKAGIPITIIGGGWSELESTSQNNVTLVSGKNFDEIFPYMERAKITLNVMPWFKAGSHDRIFNALLHYSCPLTDESSWLLEHLKPDEDCAYYSLTKIVDVPGKIYDLLSHPESRERIIRNGRKKVLDHYTSKQIAEDILHHLKECYG